jgi:hypothetical protein
VIVSAHQPNFFPWLGFFDKLARADVLVLLDDVQFPRSGAGVWTNRVGILVGGERRWLTVPVERAGRGYQQINEVRIDDAQPWRRKLLRTLEQNYAKAPAFDEAFTFVRSLFETEAQLLAKFNELALRAIARKLGLDEGRIRLSSEVGADGQGTDLLIALTRALGGSTYLSGDGAGGYQEDDRFRAAGVELRFQKFQQSVYPQRSTEFVGGLSVLDALLHCGFEGTQALLA